MVGEDGGLVPFGGAADDHVQHPVRGLDVMFLPEEEQIFQLKAKRPPGPRQSLK